MEPVNDDRPYPILREVLENHLPDEPGWAAEFGVWSGHSMGLIAEHMPVIGFDSFAGLPEDWRPEFPKGAFSTEGDASLGLELLPPANAMVVPGWFVDTVPRFPFPLLWLVHIDCDVYSSTVTALEGITRSVQPGKTVIVFDEFHGYEGWENHEAKAWDEWVSEHKVIYTEIAVGVEERAFRIERVCY